MPQVDVQVRGFSLPTRQVNGSHSLELTFLELAWGVVSVGAPNAIAALRNIMASLAFTGHKALVVATTLRSDGVNFVHPSHYRRLDQSEKVSLSYWLGMGMAKVIAAEVLNVPWLSHARHLKRQGVIQLRRGISTRMLPDLIGDDDTGAWHVIEAKARQASASTSDRNHWKTQACVVGTVHGATVASRSYCLTLQHPIVRAELVDPEPGEKSIEIRLDKTKFRQEYYRPYRQLFESDGANRWHAKYDQRRDGEYIFATFAAEPLSGQKLEVGLPRWVVESEFKELPSSPITAWREGKTYAGPDHVAVRLAFTETGK